MLIAGKRMKIVRGRATVWVDPGDPVPEAKNWPNLSAWVRQGFVRESRRGHQAESTHVSTKKAPSMTPPPRPVVPTPSVPGSGAKPRETPIDTSEKKRAGGVRSPSAQAPTKKQPKAKFIWKLKGKGECPYCKKDFTYLERHKCKKTPR